MAGCVLVACLFLRRKRRKQLADQLSCKLREEALDRALANPLAPTGRSVLDPVQVEYSMKADRQGGGALLRLTEHNLTVTRVYLFDLDQRLFLGSRTTKPCCGGITCPTLASYAKSAKTTTHSARGGWPTAADCRGERP